MVDFGFWILFILRILLKVTNVTIQSYQFYQWTPKMALNGQEQYNKLFFARMAKKSHGRSPPQELQEGLCSGPYLLVNYKNEYS